MNASTRIGWQYRYSLFFGAPIAPIYYRGAEFLAREISNCKKTCRQNDFLKLPGGVLDFRGHPSQCTHRTQKKVGSRDTGAT